MDPRPSLARSIRWSAWDGLEEGLEHLDIRSDGTWIIAAGVIVGSDDNAYYGMKYRLVIDRAWRLREAHLETTGGQSLHLESDGKGAWHENGRPRPDLRDCIDIDIQATPLTNTLPIMRLGLQRGQSAAIQVVYVQAPSLTAASGRQRYTALEPGSLYRFESLDSAFKADLPVDEDGSVLNYPGLFRRLF